MTSVTSDPGDVLRRLRDARGFIFDMDGTLALGDRVNHGLRPLPGAISMLDWARSRGRPYVVFTNGTNRTPAHFARVLRDAGLDVPDDRMMTPASSAVVMFAKRGFKRVLVLGVPGLIEPLLEAGIEVVPPAEPLPRLPVGRAVWRPSPDFQTSATSWLQAGAAHHTCMSTAVGIEAFEDFARIAGTELLTIDETTTVRAFENELRWNAAYYRLARGI